MTTTEVQTRDFFISYNHRDREWAEWIAWELEAAGFSTIIQAWDFGAGGNFVVEMDEASRLADRTLAVLSPGYLASSFTRPEWTAAFAQDPTSIHRKLIPVRVEECELTGLLAQIVYIDLVGKSEEESRETLLAQIRSRERAKPTSRPTFAGGKSVRSKPTTRSASPGFPSLSRAIWSVPHAYNAYFTGRDAELTALHALLTRQGDRERMQAISGLGGIGKTQLAVAYAYAHRQDYTAILWANADSEHQLLADYREFARLLELGDTDTQNADELRETVKAWLTEVDGWLLILDNVNDLTLIKRYLPIRYNGRIVVTTRIQDCRAIGIAAPIGLKQLSPEASTTFLLSSTGRQATDTAEREAAHRLGIELGGLPLALEQAAAYIAQNETRFQSYLKSFMRRRLTLLSVQAPITGDYQQSVATTWEMNFEAVRTKSRASVELMKLSALLAPDKIPVELLVKHAAELGPVLAEALEDADEDELVLDDLLQPLTRYSLIQRNSQTNSYDVHRLVQEVTRSTMDEAELAAWKSRAIRAVCGAFPVVQCENWPTCGRLLPHALLCAEYIIAEGSAEGDAVDLLERVGDYLYDQHEYLLAEKMVAAALPLREKAAGDTSPAVAKTCNRLAMIYKALGRYGDAEPLYLRAIRIWEAQGADLPDSLKPLNNLANLYGNQARFEEAEALHRKSLALREKLYGVDSEAVARSLSNLAGVLEDEGHFEEQGGRSEKAEARFREAEALFRRAYGIYYQLRGPDHFEAAATLHNVAMTLASLNQLREAERLYRQVYEILSRTLGPEDPYTATCLHNVARLCIKEERFVEAASLGRIALTIREKALGADHPDVAESLKDLGRVYQERGHEDEALTVLGRAYEIGLKQLGPEHRATLDYRDRYVALLRECGKNQEADAILQGNQAVVFVRP